MVKVVSANRLSDGAVVFAGRDDPWVESIDAAALLDTAETVEAALVAARADEALNLVVDAFVVDIAVEADTRRALTLRDRIRAAGPTIAYGRDAHPTRGAA